MRNKLIIDGNAVYEIDEDCIRKREEEERNKSKKRKKDDMRRKSKYR